MDPVRNQRHGIHAIGVRRSAHVKWDGKTIALGTFSETEAADKCEQAKALTRNWRSTMVPKPDVEWVKKALERLGIRVVNDRPGRRRKEETEKERNASTLRGPHVIGGDDQLYDLTFMGRQDKSDSSMFFSPQQQYHSNVPSTGNENCTNGMTGMAGCGINSLISSRNMAGNKRRFSNVDGSDMAQLHALQMRNNLIAQNSYQQGFPPFDFGMSVVGDNLDSSPACRQHYGVLKEHHDNLIKELHQTSYMMQMYQQSFQQ